MGLSKQQIHRLNVIIETAKKVIATSDLQGTTAATGKTRRRRSADDAEKMRAQIRAARAKGVPASKLAEKYRVSTAYIYMIK